jgi:hypothetical protein
MLALLLGGCTGSNITSVANRDPSATFVATRDYEAVTGCIFNVLEFEGAGRFEHRIIHRPAQRVVYIRAHRNDWIGLAVAERDIAYEVGVRAQPNGGSMVEVRSEGVVINDETRPIVNAVAQRCLA